MGGLVKHKERLCTRLLLSEWIIRNTCCWRFWVRCLSLVWALITGWFLVILQRTRRDEWWFLGSMRVRIHLDSSCRRADRWMINASCRFTPSLCSWRDKHCCCCLASGREEKMESRRNSSFPPSRLSVLTEGCDGRLFSLTFQLFSQLILYSVTDFFFCCPKPPKALYLLS